MSDLLFPTVDLGRAQEWRLKDALLCYASGDQTVVLRGAVSHAPDGIPRLGALSPVTGSFLSALRARTRRQMPVEVLPANVLYRAPGVIVWWSAPGLQRLYYRDPDGVFSQLHGYVVHVPSCVWRLVEGRHLAVRAVASSDRPVASTPLAVAPFWNTYANAEVCLGTMRVPHRDAVEVIVEWERAFWASEFTHPNANRGDLVRHPDGFFGAWIAARTAPFADAWLVPADETLAAFIAAAHKH